MLGTSELVTDVSQRSKEVLWSFALHLQNVLVSISGCTGALGSVGLILAKCSIIGFMLSAMELACHTVTPV